MREIKFRAWDKKNKRMLKPENVILIPKLEGGAQAMSGANYDYILMQYTGMQDKDGKEIYEGDLLGRPRYYPFSVKWINYKESEYSYKRKEFCWKAIDNIGWNIGQQESKKLTIVGNIYQNPELLKI